MTNITRLNPEIILEIMELLDLSDICPLIETSPLFLQHFLTHRHQLLKSTVNDLNHRLVRCNFSMLLSALRLRCRHSENAPSTQSEVREAEHASLRLYRHQDARIELSTTAELGLIHSARQLLIELEGVTDSYAPKAWCEKQDSKMVKPASLVLSLNEKRRFIQTAIHFETYCRMFFLQEKVLFKRNASIRQLFFNSTNETFVEQGPFYSITYYVFNQYLTMIKNTTTNLPTTMPPSRDQVKQRSRWERQTRVEMLNFAHVLTSQGVGLLYKMQCMNLLTQTEFMLDWFYKVSQSPDPLVLMVNGIDLHRKGTLEPRPWQPWEGIEGQSYRTLAPWRRGSYFWDRDRIQSLGGIPL
ncbi:hypothetical protein FIE12Z_10888 [Fusarium flagelliforme]|uniref:F-box domain-containing protein n=1 Tax=Fusarium flagelliforme TaxID=2675880 RepID=A0A395MAF9_9HYPO|nr:hypothetical protein FIE12Z_10888 [Fusarium flagelliforme]